MTPPAIVARAAQVGLDVVAITDHNTAGNVPAVQQAAAGSPLVVLAGMEVESREGVHVLCLCDRQQSLQELEREVWAHLPPGKNDPEYFGRQLLMDARGGVLAEWDRMLQMGTELTVSQVMRLAAELGALAIPSHVDRRASGMLDVLGFLPVDIATPAVEISGRLSPEQAYARYPCLAGVPLLYGSDAHFLAEVGQQHNLLEMEGPTVAELALALRGVQGRRWLGRGQVA